jgi:hypothetical protein
MADDPNKVYSNTTVTIPLKGGLHQLGPDLEEKELAGIGWVTAHWASPVAKQFPAIRSSADAFGKDSRTFGDTSVSFS